jgi:hypothetical protein
MTSPTVVLVHGAFADASSWSGVIAELQAAGVNVTAPPNQLRGIPTDAAYLTQFRQPARRPDGPRRTLLRRRVDHPVGD